MLRDRQPIPPAFDAAFYRAANPDLAFADDRAARRHYEDAGRADGRIASAFARAETLVAAIDLDRPALEIGPFCKPRLHGGQVRYLDMLDAAALRARANVIGEDASGCPERIDYVGTLDGVAERFATAFSSHTIEHQPDLVRHLGEVAEVLEPNGLYCLVIPDKRYCFDHFLPETSVADVIDAFHEGRTAHAVRHVVEHSALVTHNDPVRHWRGDHGGHDAAEQARRAAEAIAAVEASEGGYLDVHAHKFTPASFRLLMATLAELGLSPFEVEAVYDTPRDRAEFCAILRRARTPRRRPRRDHGLDVVVMQTADPFRYAPMLAVTAPLQIEFCRRHGFRYESYVGIRRGPWTWQASFNRVEMLGDLLDGGFTGWAVYLDADAFIHDLDFDLPAYLAGHADRGAILATSGVTGEPWDVNSGVALVNFAHPQGRRLVEAWRAGFRAISDERLRRERRWIDDDNDQDLLHRMLREDRGIAAATHIESMAVLNSAHARFIRQRVRAQFASFEDRLREIAVEVSAAMRAGGLEPPPPAARAAERERALLLHPIRGRPWLAEAPAAVPDPEAAEQAIAVWRAWPAEADAAPNEAAFAAMLAAGDAAGVAREIATLGRSTVSQGLLGGARQHRRCAEDPVFAHQRALRTADALLSLAEHVGAISMESPEIGRWGQASALPPADLARRVSEMIGADLRPPAGIGAYLGIDVGGAVLHQRMIEAIYAAVRLGQTAHLLGAASVSEIGGGIGLTAFYAVRLGLSAYTLMPRALLGAVQACVLGRGGARIVPLAGIAADRPGEIAFADDILAELPVEAASACLRGAADRGARALLSFHQETGFADAALAPGLHALAAGAGGWRLATRGRHALRPGVIEELYVR